MNECFRYREREKNHQPPYILPVRTTRETREKKDTYEDRHPTRSARLESHLLVNSDDRRRTSQRSRFDARFAVL